MSNDQKKKKTKKRIPVPRRPLRIRLTLDSGLAAYLRAYLRGVGFWHDERDLILFLLRMALWDKFGSATVRSMMMPHLPDDIQRAYGIDPAKLRAS